MLSKEPADILASVPNVDAALAWCEKNAGAVRGARAVARARWSARDRWVFAAGVGAGSCWARRGGSRVMFDVAVLEREDRLSVAPSWRERWLRLLLLRDDAPADAERRPVCDAAMRRLLSLS